MKKGAASEDRANLFNVLIITILLNALLVVAPASLLKAGGLVAEVVDTKGKSYTVERLGAKYMASGQWIGSVPQSILKKIYISWDITEDRVTYTEELKIPFSEIRRMLFDKGRITEVEKRNGTAIKLVNEKGKTTIIERDKNGKQKILGKSIRCSYRSGNLYLSSFKGRAKAKSGREGNFNIDIYEVNKIEFK